VRILLAASQEARLGRRARELHGQAGEAAISATHDQIVRRDRDDSTVSEFMVAAPGVTLLDTTDLEFQQSVDAVLQLVGARIGRTRPAGAVSGSAPPGIPAAD
jgi:cytidylate kinase